jgi:hypothetical protein
VDVIGVVVKASKAEKIMSKSQKELDKRTLTLVDQSSITVRSRFCWAFLDFRVQLTRMACLCRLTSLCGATTRSATATKTWPSSPSSRSRPAASASSEVRLCARVPCSATCAHAVVSLLFLLAGRSLNASFGSHLMINPDIKPAHELRAWFDSQGRERVSAFESLSKGRTPGGGGGDWRKSFAQVRDEKLGTKDKVHTSILL